MEYREVDKLAIDELIKEIDEVSNKLEKELKSAEIRNRKECILGDLILNPINPSFKYINMKMFGFETVLNSEGDYENTELTYNDVMKNIKTLELKIDALKKLKDALNIQKKINGYDKEDNDKNKYDFNQKSDTL